MAKAPTAVVDSLESKVLPDGPLDFPSYYVRVGWRWEREVPKLRPHESLLFQALEDAPKLSIYLHQIIRRTPNGLWVEANGERFILYKAKRRYCYPTTALALTSFMARREKYLFRLERELERSKDLLSQALDPEIIPKMKAKLDGLHQTLLT